VVAVVLVLLVGLASAPGATTQRRAEVPAGFEDSLAATVDEYPTDLAWLGDDLLIATIGGKLYRLPGADPAAPLEVLLDIQDVVGTGREQGLVGVVADPGFAAGRNRFLYVYYTRDEGGCSNQFRVPPPDPSRCFNRLSRFDVPAAGAIDPASEKPLLPFVPVGIPNHNSGDLAFGKDGKLYLTVGDGGIETGAGAEKAQDLGDLHGKVLRLDRDGSPPRDNPFAGKDAVACGQRLDGAAPATAPRGKRCAEIFAYGLRNPFRFAFDPNARGVRFFVNDVGEATWEEINLGRAKANYGWPRREGGCDYDPATALAECGGANPRRFQAPIHAYNHDDGCTSVTAGAFVPAGSDWGREFRGAYLFGDWTCGTIFVLREKARGKGFDAEVFATPDAARPDSLALTALLFDRSGDVLYYAGESDPDGRSQIRAIQRAD
jgi:glucose/arabinose dehydrogenase